MGATQACRPPIESAMRLWLPMAGRQRWWLAACISLGLHRRQRWWLAAGELDEARLRRWLAQKRRLLGIQPLVAPYVCACAACGGTRGDGGACTAHDDVGRASAVKLTPEPVKFTPVKLTVGYD